MMRGRGRLVALELAALTLAALTLSGCSGPPAPPPAPPSPTATQVFASEDEALAAATEAYAAYRAASDLFSAGGARNIQLIEPYMTVEYAADMGEDIEQFQANGFSTVGTSSFDSVQLQSVFDDGMDAQVVLYLCSDTSDVRLIDAMGSDVGVETRQTRLPLEIQLRSGPSNAHSLLIDGSELWSGDDFC